MKILFWMAFACANAVVASHPFTALGSTPSAQGAVGARSAKDCARLLASASQRTEAQTGQELDEALSRLKPEQRRKLDETLEAIYFIDFRSAGAQLIETFTGDRELLTRGDRGFLGNLFSRLFKKDNTLDIAKLYDTFGQKAYASWFNARKLLRSTNEELSWEMIGKAHRLAMEGGVEGLPRGALGKIRSSWVYGNAEYGVPLTDEQVSALFANPYLDYQETRRVRDGSQGKIWYPTPERARPMALDRIRDTHPEVVHDVELFQANFRGRRAPENPELTRRLVTALMEERLQWFVRQKNQVAPDGDVRRDPETLYQYVALVSEFYRDLVSIHPFPNGNGRTARLILYWLLEKEGLHPTRLLSPDDDIQMDPQGFLKELIEGIVATQRLRADLAERISLELPLAGSPELVNPQLPREAGVPQRYQGSVRVEENARLRPIDPRQAGEYVRLRLKQEPFLYQLYKTQPVETVRQLHDEFLAFARKNYTDYEHRERGQLELALFFVDRDLRDVAFGQLWASDARRWKRKLELWSIPEVMWRGLSYQDRVMSDHEILSMFIQIHPQLVSNHSMRGQHDPESLLKRIREDFDRYNQDVLTGAVDRMATDHSQTGPGYGDSYGFSCSTEHTVAKAFAMGAMVVAPYGEHQAPEHQSKLKDRILIGMYRGTKDLELNTLRQLDPDYRNRYARQREVMGVGGVDPDTVMVVHRVDAEGKIIQSWVRDPESPWQVWVVRGDFRPDQGRPPADRLITTRRLPRLPG